MMVCLRRRGNVQRITRMQQEITGSSPSTAFELSTLVRTSYRDAIQLAKETDGPRHPRDLAQTSPFYPLPRSCMRNLGVRDF
jgi:hypothetical protein